MAEVQLYVRLKTLAWVQTVPPEPGKVLVNTGAIDMTTSESVFARTSGN
jgi:hypothetical protein